MATASSGIGTASPHDLQWATSFPVRDMLIEGLTDISFKTVHSFVSLVDSFAVLFFVLTCVTFDSFLIRG